VWDVSNQGFCLKTFQSNSPCKDLAVIKDEIITIHEDGYLRVWDDEQVRVKRQLFIDVKVQRISEFDGSDIMLKKDSCVDLFRLDSMKLVQSFTYSFCIDS